MPNPGVVAEGERQGTFGKTHDPGASTNGLSAVFDERVLAKIP